MELPISNPKRPLKNARPPSISAVVFPALDPRLSTLDVLTRGYTLLEVMVATAIGSFVLLAAVSFYIFSLTSFASTSNYVDINSKATFASDIISRDIRNSSSVASAVSNQLTLNLQNDSNPVTYTYDSVAATLSRSQSGSARILLSGINSLSWSLYQ